MKVALITGGSRGIGRSTAIQIAKRGTGVILTYNNNPAKADEVVAEIKKAGGSAVALKLDTSKVSSFGEFAARVAEVLKKDFGRETFDSLVNNAGIGQRTPILETTEAQFDELVNVNFKGPFFLTQKLVPLMADGGHIINLSSGLARFSFTGVAVYGSLKAGLESLTRYFAKEFAPRKIRVNTVAPGAIDTEFGGGKGDAAHKKMIADQVALGRLGEADDIGLFIASLLSDDSRYLNGQRIEVSGGMML